MPNDLSGIAELIGQEIAKDNAIAPVAIKAEATPPVVVAPAAEVKTDPATAPAVPAKAEPAKPETKIEAKPVTANDNKDSSLNTEIKQPSFDELLAEKTGSKYKTWDELEQALNKPAEKVQDFADEQVAKINEYIKQGGKFDDYIATQSIDFKQMTLAEKLAYKMQLDDPDITDEEINLELKLKYGFDKWKDNTAEYDEGIEPEDIKLAKLKFERDANKAEKALLDYQKKWSIPSKEEQQTTQVDPAVQEKWDTSVENTLKSIEKIPLKISDKETFDYVLAPEDKKEINKLAKGLYTNVNVLFEQFKDPKSPTGFNMQGLTDMLIKVKTYDKAIALAADHARKLGEESVAKGIKNIKFNTDGSPVAQTAVKSMEEQIADGIIKHSTKT